MLPVKPTPHNMRTALCIFQRYINNALPSLPTPQFAQRRMSLAGTMQCFPWISVHLQIFVHLLAIHKERTRCMVSSGQGRIDRETNTRDHPTEEKGTLRQPTLETS